MNMWRLLLDDVARGEWNMAVDRSIQEAHAAAESPPTLRLYGWTVPTVTLGRFQRLEGVDLELCERREIDVVRRFTGGRGVLHDDEVTYSVVAGTADGMPRGVTASYRHLCSALADAYGRLGVGAELTTRPRGSASSAACYLHATHADLSIGLAKLSGSAQVWLRDTCMQHGSFTRTRDVALESAVFGLDSQDALLLEGSTTTLADLSTPVPDIPAVREAVIAGFESALGVVFEPGSLTERELTRAEELREQVRVVAPSS